MEAAFRGEVDQLDAKHKRQDLGFSDVLTEEIVANSEIEAGLDLTQTIQQMSPLFIDAVRSTGQILELTALRDLNELAACGLMVKVGKLKGARYYLNVPHVVRSLSVS